MSPYISGLVLQHSCQQWICSADLFGSTVPAEAPPIQGRSDRIRDGTDLFCGSPPSQQQIPLQNFLFSQTINFKDSAAALIGPTHYADPCRVRRGIVPPDRLPTSVLHAPCMATSCKAPKQPRRAVA